MSVALQLCDLIDVLRKQHRAGITPTFGQVEDLFDLADHLRVQARLEAPAPERVAVRGCSVRGCDGAVSAELSEHPYCGRHARVMRETLGRVQQLLHEAAVTVGRVQWPVSTVGVADIDPRD